MGLLLLEDLRKRRVVRVAVGYLLGALALVIGVALIDAWVRLPDWTMRMVAGTEFVMMPFVLVLTWALADHGPENLRTVRRR